MSRLRHWWLHKTKQTDLSYEAWSFIMAMDKSTADLAILKVLATQVVSIVGSATQAATDATAAAKQAQDALNGADATVDGLITEIINILRPLIPAQPEQVVQ